MEEGVPPHRNSDREHAQVSAGAIHRASQCRHLLAVLDAQCMEGDETEILDELDQSGIEGLVTGGERIVG